MHIRDGRLARLRHDPHGLIIQGIQRIGRRVQALNRLGPAFRRAAQDVVNVVRLAARLQRLHDIMHLVIRHKRAMHPLRDARAARQKQHIAMPQQVFSAHLIQDRPGIHLGGDLKGDAARHIGLDQAGNHIHRRPLGREDQMHPGRPRLLRQARDQFLGLLADRHHHVGQFINNDHDTRQLFEITRRVFLADGRIGRVGNGPPVAQRGADLLVIAAYISDAQQRHQFITPFHLGHAPAQRVGGLFHIGHHRRQQIRDPLIDR